MVINMDCKTLNKKVVLLCLVSTLLLILSMQTYGASRKRIAILGDSYSAYYGMIPKGYECSYAIRGVDGENKWRNNINSVKQMWWYRLIKNGHYKLSVNCSYSGSCFGYVYKGGKGNNSSSYICRMKKDLNGKKRRRISSSFRAEPMTAGENALSGRYSTVSGLRKVCIKHCRLSVMSFTI